MLSIRNALPDPPNGPRENVWSICFIRPCRPSKAFSGPVIPASASRAAKNPFRLPFGPARPFQWDSAPARVSCTLRLATAASRMAFATCSGVRPSRRPAAALVAIAWKIV